MEIAKTCPECGPATRLVARGEWADSREVLGVFQLSHLQVHRGGRARRATPSPGCARPAGDGGKPYWGRKPRRWLAFSTALAIRRRCYLTWEIVTDAATGR